MARITIEDCLEQVPNRFSLIHLAFQRVKQLRAGADPLVQSKNKEVVVALREIAARKVSFPFEKEVNPGISEIGPDSEKKELSPGITEMGTDSEKKGGESIIPIKRRRSK